MAEDKRLSFQEALHLVKLPADPSRNVERYMPGCEIFSSLAVPNRAAFGGVVYGQAALATCRAMRELEDEKKTKAPQRLGLHVSIPCLRRPQADDTDDPWILYRPGPRRPPLHLRGGPDGRDADVYDHVRDSISALGTQFQPTAGPLSHPGRQLTPGSHLAHGHVLV